MSYMNYKPTEYDKKKLNNGLHTEIKFICDH